MSTEFSTVSSSSFDPAALAAKLTEKSADGWSVVSIVSTGGDVTAFLSRSSGATASAPDPVVEATAEAAPAPAPSYDPVPAYEPAPTYEPAPAPSAPPEPSGWASAPDPAPVAPIVEAAPVYTPAPAAAPAAAATPAVPAGWYADPAGRFELRYWDGGTWTEHVSRAGQQYTDPPVA
jgi:Protein of unknown function (DUF2510)